MSDAMFMGRKFVVPMSTEADKAAASIARAQMVTRTSTPGEILNIGEMTLPVGVSPTDLNVGSLDLKARTFDQLSTPAQDAIRRNIAWQYGDTATNADVQKGFLTSLLGVDHVFNSKEHAFQTARRDAEYLKRAAALAAGAPAIKTAVSSEKAPAPATAAPAPATAAPAPATAAPAPAAPLTHEDEGLVHAGLRGDHHLQAIAFGSEFHQAHLRANPGFTGDFRVHATDGALHGFTSHVQSEDGLHSTTHEFTFLGNDRMRHRMAATGENAGEHTVEMGMDLKSVHERLDSLYSPGALRGFPGLRPRDKADKDHPDAVEARKDIERRVTVDKKHTRMDVLTNPNVAALKTRVDERTKADRKAAAQRAADRKAQQSGSAPLAMAALTT